MECDLTLCTRRERGVKIEHKTDVGKVREDRKLHEFMQRLG